MRWPSSYLCRCGNTRRHDRWVRGGAGGPDVGAEAVNEPAGAGLVRTDTRQRLAAERERRMHAEEDGRLLAEKLRQQEHELAAVCDAAHSTFYMAPTV